jgi:membrane peptidoglycan carboxypeptidase
MPVAHRHILSKSGKLLRCAAVLSGLLMVGLPLCSAAAAETPNTPERDASAGESSIGIYSDIFKSPAGRPVPAEVLRQELLARRYSEIQVPGGISHGPQKAGEFLQQGTSFQIISRAFYDAQGLYHPVLSLRFDSQNGSLVNNLGPALDALVLEPAPLPSLPAEYLNRELKQRLPANVSEIPSAGLYTSIDPVFQHCAEAALKHPLFSRPDWQCSLVAVKPESGKILAWTRTPPRPAGKQPPTEKQHLGSLLRPFIFLTALDPTLDSDFHATAVTPVSDENVSPPAGEQDTETGNSSHIASAMELQDADAAATIARRIGAKGVLNTLHLFGLANGAPLEHGIENVSLVDVTAAFAALAAGGRLTTPTALLSLRPPGAAEIELSPPVSRDAADKNAVFVLTTLLRNNLSNGPAKEVRDLGLLADVAGIAGASKNQDEVWFEGFSPSLAAGVWMAPATAAGTQLPADAALRIWTDFFKCAAQYSPPEVFTRPDGVELLKIDVASGARATESCPPESVRELAFLKGSAPRDFCRLHSGSQPNGSEGAEEGTLKTPRHSRSSGSSSRLKPIWKRVRTGVRHLWD